MGMSKDLYRQLHKKTRYWQRMLKEKAYQRQTIKDHNREFSSILDAKKEKARQASKISQMLRH